MSGKVETFDIETEDLANTLGRLMATRKAAKITSVLKVE